LFRTNQPVPYGRIHAEFEYGPWDAALLFWSVLRSTSMLLPVLVVLIPLAWIVAAKVIDWAYWREHSKH
jgi:hypothetical protein